MDGERRSLVIQGCFVDIHADFSRQIEKLESETRAEGLRVVFIGSSFASCAYLIRDVPNDRYLLYKGRYFVYIYGHDAKPDAGEDSVSISTRIARRTWSKLKPILFNPEDPAWRRRDPLLVVQRPEEGPLVEACMPLIERGLIDQQPGCRELISSYLTETLYAHCLKNIDTLDTSVLSKLRRVVEAKEIVLGIQNSFCALVAAHFMERGGLDVFSCNIEDFVESYIYSGANKARSKSRDMTKEDIWLRKDVAYLKLIDNRTTVEVLSSLRPYIQYIDDTYILDANPGDPVVSYTKKVLVEDGRSSTPGMLSFLMASGMSFMRSNRSKYIAFATGSPPPPMCQVLSRQRRKFLDECYSRLVEVYSAHSLNQRLHRDRRIVKVPERDRSSPRDQRATYHHHKRNHSQEDRKVRQENRRNEKKEEPRRFKDEEKRTPDNKQQTPKKNPEEEIKVVVTVNSPIRETGEFCDEDVEVLDYGNEWWIDYQSQAQTLKRKREDEAIEIESKRAKLEEIVREEHKEDFERIGQIAAEAIEAIVKEPDQDKANQKLNNLVEEVSTKLVEIVNEDPLLQEMMEADAWLEILNADMEMANGGDVEQ